MNRKNTGKVFLAGAGPGDAGLITVKAMEKISEADVILYDKLINHELLKYVKESCEKIYVGKESGSHTLPQREIIDVLIKKSSEGKTVVRLKGGDPLIFGRGSEEALALQDKGIEFEIIPGITAASGASAYSGIPLTHRNVASQCIFLTAHESPDKENSQIEWEKIARMTATTIVIYMGAGLLQEIVETLIKHGMPGNMPAAMIENATAPSQRTVCDLLENLPQRYISENLKPPVLTIISPTVTLSNKLNWFEKKPLFGKRIVITKSVDKVDAGFRLLAEMGADPIPFQLIKTEISKPERSINYLISGKKFDWLIFSSGNGVKYFFELLHAEGFDSRLLNGVNIASIGTETAEYLREEGITADFIPSEFSSVSFVKEFPEMYDLSDKRLLRIKGDFTQDTLADGLKSCCAFLESLQVYSIKKETPDNSIKEQLIAKNADAYMFTSGSLVINFFDLFGSETALKLLGNSITMAIGDLTAKALLEKNVEKIIISPVHTIKGMIEMLTQLLTC